MLPQPPMEASFSQRRDLMPSSERENPLPDVIRPIVGTLVCVHAIAGPERATLGALLLVDLAPSTITTRADRNAPRAVGPDSSAALTHLRPWLVRAASLVRAPLMRAQPRPAAPAHTPHYSDGYSDPGAHSPITAPPAPSSPNTDQHSDFSSCASPQCAQSLVAQSLVGTNRGA